LYCPTVGLGTVEILQRQHSKISDLISIFDGIALLNAAMAVVKALMLCLLEWKVQSCHSAISDFQKGQLLYVPITIHAGK
jgi:hypothetical protein